MRIADRTKWLGLLSGAVFLSVSSYIRWKFVFESGNTGGMLLLIALIAAGFSYDTSTATIRPGSRTISKFLPKSLAGPPSYPAFRRSVWAPPAQIHEPQTTKKTLDSARSSC